MKKHASQIITEFQKLARDESLFPGQPGWEDQHSTDLSNQIENEKFAHPMQGDPGYGHWFTKELKRRVDENHAKEAADADGVPDGTEFRTFNFTVKVESATRFFECGQDCPYLEYQGNPTGEYRGTPWCNLFKKDLGYPRSPDGTSHPIRSPECISAVEGLM